MNDQHSLTFFLGANSPLGFVSHFDQLTDPKQARHAYLLKGGPGSGKSTLLKRIAEELSDWGTIEEIHCSSDVSSLDAVILGESGISVVDATLPHAIEPRYPGVVETIVPLGECWDRHVLAAHREEVIEIGEQKRRLNEQCCKYLAAAASLLSDTYRLAMEVTDLAKVDRVAKRIAANEWKAKHGGEGREKIRLLSAVTDLGQILYSQTARKLASRIYRIEDDYGPSSKRLLASLKEQALTSGYDVYSCFCPISPYERVEHLFIPELSLGFMTESPFLSPDIVPDRVINARRFTSHDGIRQRKKRISFNRKAAQQMMAQATSLIADARRHHQRLEEIYQSAMDYGAVTELGDRLLDAIRSYR